MSSVPGDQRPQSQQSGYAAAKAPWAQSPCRSGGLYLANALIGFIFAASGPVAIILAVGALGGLSESGDFWIAAPMIAVFIALNASATCGGCRA